MFFYSNLQKFSKCFAPVLDKYESFNINSESFIEENFRKSSKILGRVYTILTFSKVQQTTTCKKVFHTTAKLFLSGLCFISSLSALEPAKKNFSNETIQILFAYGDAFAWGSLSTYCITNIYDSIFRDKPNLGIDQTLCTIISYWTSVFALGLLTELPTVYTTWYYNSDSKFLYIYSPIINSFFSIFSVHEFFQILSNHDCFLKFNDRPENLKIDEAKKKLCQLLNYCKESISQKPNQVFQQMVEDICLEKNQEESLGNIVNYALNIGLEHSKSDCVLESHRTSKMRERIKFVSSFLPFGSPVLDGILIYKGYRLIFKSIVPVPFIIALSVTPGIYLQVKLSQDFYDSLFTQLVSLSKSKSSHRRISWYSIASNALKWSIILFFTASGLAGDITIVRDNIGFNNFFGALIGVSEVSTMAILLISSMSSMASDFAKFYQQGRQIAFHQIESESLIERIYYLEKFFRQIPRSEFEQSLREIGIEINVLSN